MQCDNMLNSLVPFISILCFSAALGETLEETLDLPRTYDSYQKPIFSTKTAYDWLKPEASDYFGTTHGLQSTVQYEQRNCSAVYINSVLRHGSRYPGSDDIATMFNIERLLNKLNLSDESNHLAWELRNWQSPFSEEDSGLLLELGAREHFDNGIDFARTFSDLIVQNGTLLPMEFMSSYKQRCRESLKAFKRGMKSYLQKMSDESDSEYNYDESVFENMTQQSINNHLMRFFDTCTKYRRMMKNMTFMSEYHEFYNSNHMNKVVDSVHKRFGLNDSFFETEDVRVMHVACAIEQCFTNVSNWCQLFDEDDFKVLEYLGDLKQYWKCSYGNQISYEQSCPLAKSIVEDLQNSVNAHIAGERYTVAKFMFGHAETMAPLYAALGLFNDSDFLQSESYEQVVNRKFRTSFILPFGANIVAVAYHCSPQQTSDAAENTQVTDAAGSRPTSEAVETRWVTEATNSKHDDGQSEDKRPNHEDYVVQFYVNKHPVAVPGCGATCPLEKFMSRYGSFLNCNYEEICSLDSSKVEL
ncbi:multiple inositol polyphosphate phosphatase 1-like [Octopus sinensis]|uniref:Multiple inositol polyphosphate phosphatase 1 n=1 Tax=Octopus sinensis TaxID=2607531 RepID=A0A6P7TTJ1_9MOLL|nr:multiple inositol polyphosphate phosphatase 1-like [Octopus sinensis]